MKLFKIKVPLGFMMLSKNYEINFLVKTRVDKESANSELIEIEDNFYYPIETVFIGKNSSGKTTTLSLIQTVFVFLRTGRIDNSFLRDGKSFELQFVYYHNGLIYDYHGLFTKDKNKNDEYLIIQNESLVWAKMKQSLKKDLSNATFFEVKSFEKNVGGDTSNIVRYQSHGDFNLSIDHLGYSTRFFNLFYNVLHKETFDALLHLFDDSVEYIVPYSEESDSVSGYRFKRFSDNSEIIVKNEYLESILSAGTIRGINLYGASILAFKGGGTIWIDEIERSFNRNLIENLLLMFGDKTINKMKASIIYTTHYSELLDNNDRCDNINVLHRNGNDITLKNMKTDYKCRTDMLKSGQFNQNVFDTLINYERLMDLKESIRGK